LKREESRVVRAVENSKLQKAGRHTSGRDEEKSGGRRRLKANSGKKKREDI